MALFALGNLMLKYKRRSLPREIQSPVWATVVGLFLVLVALIGNGMYFPFILLITCHPLFVVSRDCAVMCPSTVGSRPQDLLPFLIFFVAAVCPLLSAAFAVCSRAFFFLRFSGGVVTILDAPR